jgi:acyl-CoA thioester hydrolase
VDFLDRFYETDALQHVGNTVLVGWFEAARTPIFKMFVPSLSFDNWPLILANYNVDFLQQIFMQSPVKIQTFVSKIGNSSFKVCQECWQDDILKARGTTTMVHFDYETKKSVKIPDNVRALLQEHLIDKQE